jgi:cysteine sulfinate desulfinase/cysteine desulfurase-like protein
MGISRERARGSLRLSMGGETTSDEVDAVIAILSGAVHSLHAEA